MEAINPVICRRCSEVISTAAAVRQGGQPSAAPREELLATVQRALGRRAVIGELRFVDERSKTPSSKIVRRVLESIILHRAPSDITTIEDAGSVGEALQAWQEMR